MTASPINWLGLLHRRRRFLSSYLSAWTLLGVIAVPAFVLRDRMTWLTQLPRKPILSLNAPLNIAMDWFVQHFQWFFRAITWTLNWPLNWLRDALLWLPWSVTVLIVIAVAQAAAGWRLALFSAFALLYILFNGYWDESMSTIALIGVSVPLAIIFGFVGGMLAFASPLLSRISRPVLDGMQTIPAFAYLIPILLLFGFGPVVGIVASAIYAIPPMVRNVELGLRRVPEDVVEAGRASGCTPLQLNVLVRVPCAIPTIMLGINQTIMAALGMVIMSSVIGGFADIGWEVLSTMRRALFGESLLAGGVIALIAMVLDRISGGFSHRAMARTRAVPVRILLLRFGVWASAGIVLFIVAHYVAVLQKFPDSWTMNLAQPIDDFAEYIAINYYDLTVYVKEKVLYFLLIPLRVGFENAARERFWGFDASPTTIAAYWSLVIASTMIAARLLGWRSAVAVAVFGTVYYFGVTGIPWPLFIAAATLAGARLGGWRLGSFALISLSFILLTGVWMEAMLSFQLCFAAVIIAFFLGSALGIWASLSDSVSMVLRPICDTLQTMPTFVFLIPVIMLFQIGEFPALVAIVAYAITPAMRYTEHGLRQVPADIVEAARAMGCTNRQILFQVRLPLAMPEILLGLNQTVMFGIAMLVVAALVGTRDLGQLVFNGLTSADFGLGFIAGGSIALIAILIDRMLQSWSLKMNHELGLNTRRDR